MGRSLLFPLVPFLVIADGDAATGGLSLLDGACARLADCYLDGTIYASPAEELVVAHLGQVDGVAFGPLADLVKLKPQVLAAGASTVTLQIQSRPDSRLQGVIPITVRATALQADRWPVKSIVDVEVEFK